MSEREQRPDYMAGGNFVDPETRMTVDSLNIWSALGSIANNPDDPAIGDLLPLIADKDLPTYEEYTRKMNSDRPEYANEIIRDTDPSKLARFNELVLIYNKEREQIIRELNVQRLAQIFKEAESLIRNP
jgi:hypothetical protein